MKYPAEDIACQLHQELVRRFGELSPTVEGAGVHLHCTVGRGDRSCWINCFTLSNECEYLTSYNQEAKTLAFSRVPSSHDTIEAVSDWLDGVRLAEMYDRYSFIDKVKRSLERTRDEAFAAEPELQRTAVVELKQNAGDIYTLLFRGCGRSCEVSFYGKNEWPDAKFSSDECQLFQYQPHDNVQFASVLKAWLCDTLSSSVMRSRFPWLTIGELADYYEAGKPVEGEFDSNYSPPGQKPACS